MGGDWRFDQMPSKANIENLGMRISAIEVAVARIETQLAAEGRPAAAPGPARTRKPPAKGAVKAGAKPGRAK